MKRTGCQMHPILNKLREKVRLSCCPVGPQHCTVCDIICDTTHMNEPMCPDCIEKEIENVTTEEDTDNGTKKKRKKPTK